MTVSRLALLLALLVAAPGCREPSSPTPDATTPTDIATPDVGPDTPDIPWDADAPPAARRLRIATFNVHRFFDTVCDSGSCAAGDYEYLPSPAAFAAETERVARGVRALAADIVLLEEIETDACLDALRDRLGTRYPTAVLGEIGVPASVDVAVLASLPLIAVRRHRDTPIHRPDGSATLFSREFLEVHLDAGGQRVVVFAAHFRSMADDDPGRRIGEAAAARDIVAATAREFPSALVVLGGDLNDWPGSATLTALEDGGAMARVASDLPAPQQITHPALHLALDHLYRCTLGGGRYLPGSALVVADSATGLAGSDHAGLRADFEVP